MVLVNKLFIRPWSYEPDLRVCKNELVIGKVLLERVGHIALNGCDVLGEAVDDATRRRELEELHGASQDRVEHIAMGLGGRGQHALQEHVVGEKAHHTVHKAERHEYEEVEHLLVRCDHNVARRRRRRICHVRLLLSCLILAAASESIEPHVGRDREDVAHHLNEQERAHEPHAARAHELDENAQLDL